MKYTISVVGMGYVGVASAVVFANVDKVDRVYGIQRESERSGKKIDMLNSGTNPFPEEMVLGTHLRSALRDNKFECTSDFSVVEDSNVLLIDVQTPFVGQTPDFSHLMDAIHASAPHLCNNVLVSIESTVTPGSTDGWISEEFEKCAGMIPGDHYSLCHAPERVKPGKLISNIYTVDRCVGGVTPQCTSAAVSLYSLLSRNSARVIPMTAREAEFTKTAENAIRDLQIATANQLALYAEIMGINYYNVAKGIKSLRGVGVDRCLLEPGAGVGGHCLVKDTAHLEAGIERNPAWLNDLPTCFSSLFVNARSINRFMPEHMFNLTIKGLMEKKLDYGFNRHPKIGILGWSFAENTSDSRNTPTKEYVDMFYDNKLNVNDVFAEFEIKIHDPYSTGDGRYTVTNDISDVLHRIDTLVVFVNHSDYSWLTAGDVMNIGDNKNILVVDGRNMFNPDDFISLGCIYKGIGRGDINR